MSRTREENHYKVPPIRLLALGKNRQEHVNYVVANIVIESGKKIVESLGGVDDHKALAAVESRGFDEEMFKYYDMEDCYAFVLGSDSFPGLRFNNIGDCLLWYKKGREYLARFDKNPTGKVHHDMICRALRSENDYRMFACTAAVESIIGKQPHAAVHSKHLRVRMLGYLSTDDIFDPDAFDSNNRPIEHISIAGEKLLDMREDGAWPLPPHTASYLLTKGWRAKLWSRDTRKVRTRRYSTSLDQKQIMLEMAALEKRKHSIHREAKEAMDAYREATIGLFKTTHSQQLHNNPKKCREQSCESVAEPVAKVLSKTPSSKHLVVNTAVKHLNLNSTAQETVVHVSSDSPKPAGEQQVNSRVNLSKMSLQFGGVADSGMTSEEVDESEAHQAKTLEEEQTVEIQREEMMHTQIAEETTREALAALTGAHGNWKSIEQAFGLNPSPPRSAHSVMKFAEEQHPLASAYAADWFNLFASDSERWKRESWQIAFLDWTIKELTAFSKGAAA